MDFELEQNVILCYENAGQASVCQEETQEAIVPDACPDILRIVEVCAQAFPSRCEMGEGHATVVGVIQANVLYMPETGALLQSIPLKLPFSVRVDIPGSNPGVIPEMAAQICHADARILNPRKLLLRCDLMVEVSALCRREHTVSTAVRPSEQTQICQQQQSVEYERMSAAPQRIFPISEEIRLTGSQPPILLASMACAHCNESRIIGSKLIFKGKVDVDLLLQTSEGEMEHRLESFPFSQILEAKEAGESGSCHVQLELSEFSCVQPLDDPYHLMIEAEVLAMGRVHETAQLAVLTDLYSISHHCLLEEKESILRAPSQQTVIPQTLRELLETDDVVRTVCNCRFQPGPVLCVPDQNALSLSIHGYISALYLDEERRPRLIETQVELTTRCNISPDSQVLYLGFLPGEVYAAPCVGGIEVRLNGDFSLLTADSLIIRTIQSASLGEARNANQLRPSVTLRRPEEGESLWDIAKACGSTCEEILQANELTGEELPIGKLLLIPGCR